MPTSYTAIFVGTHTRQRLARRRLIAACRCFSSSSCFFREANLKGGSCWYHLISLVSLASPVTCTMLPSFSQFFLEFPVLQRCSPGSARSFQDTFLLQPQLTPPPWTTPAANTLATARSRYEFCPYLSCKIRKASKALESIRHHPTDHSTFICHLPAMILHHINQISSTSSII